MDSEGYGGGDVRFDGAPLTHGPRGSLDRALLVKLLSKYGHGVDPLLVRLREEYGDGRPDLYPGAEGYKRRSG